MDMKEKLVELIFESLCRHIHKSCKLAENIADELIADGVTVQEDCKECAEATQNCIVKLQEQIAELRSVQEWISVKDRLPEVDEEVLVCGANGISIDWLEDYGELGLRWGNLCCGSYNPKYWQPLPQPPKGE